MSLVMDRRIALRRHRVLEEDARLRLRWLVAFFGTVAAAGVLLGVVRSPWLDVDVVRVSGANRADVSAALAAADVRVGAPMFSVDAAAIETALSRDPWVARAEASVVWPNVIEITVLEHQSVAWIESKNGWMRISAAGTVVDRGEPPTGAARVSLEGPVAGKLGETIESPAAQAAVAFLTGLPAEMRRKARVWGDETSLVARVQGRRIELGTTTQMPEKAAVVAGLIDADRLDMGLVLNVVAPNRPAIRDPESGETKKVNPRVVVEGEALGLFTASTSG